jgi:sugar O-acyltransferase (sialic acid O-acetyltransferase NeuD family)
MSNQEIILIGYSGHAFVVCEAFLSQNYKVFGYYEKSLKPVNPYDLTFLGDEQENLFRQENQSFFVAIGDNHLRRKIFNHSTLISVNSINAIHKSAVISSNSTLGKGVLVSALAVINPLSIIENGVILNTSSVVEHECHVSEFAHIGPGAVLCGNVSIGKNTFVGANSVIKQGIKIGDNVIIGAGSVVIKDVESNTTVVGNPSVKIN